MIYIITSLLAISFGFGTEYRFETNKTNPSKYQIDVIYGHKDGMALTYDIIKPRKPNGSAVICMVSFRWKSKWMHPEMVLLPTNPWTPILKNLLKEGFQLYLVRHGSSPKYNIPECAKDVREAAVHIKENAKKNNIDHNKIFAMGISAGAHLSLLLATDPNPIVSGCIGLCPPTIMRDVQQFKDNEPAFDYDASLNESMSPALRINKNTPPVLIFQGDKDTIVIPDHGYEFKKEMKKKERDIELIMIKDATHYFTKDQLKYIQIKTIRWIKEKEEAIRKKTNARDHSE